MAGKRMVLLDPSMAGSTRILELASQGKWRTVSVHLFALMWVTDRGTNGFLRRESLKFVHGRKADAAALVEAGLWQEFENGWGLLDWAENQMYRPREPVPRAVRQRVFERDGFVCVTCGSPDNLSIDHIHPWSLGGTNELENLQTLCQSCNARKGARV